MDYGDPRLPQRFWDKVIPEPNTGCWLWFAASNALGYGRFNVANKLRYPHRMTYAIAVGDPGSLEIDHLCRQPACCNPGHLEAVTHRVNTLRSDSPSAQHARRGHCIRGHAWTAETRYIDPKGLPRCRPCAKQRKREAAAKRRVAA